MPQKITRRKSQKRTISRRSSTESAVGDVSRSIRRRKPKSDSPVEFLGSGCTTLNLALSGKGPSGGWARGRVLNIVGDGSSGKTMLALELMFWCFKFIEAFVSRLYPKVKKFQLVFNNVEGVMDFPVKKMYGPKFFKKVIWLNSKNIEEMGRDYSKRLKNLGKGEFLLYVIDSWDALGSEAGDERFDEAMEDDKPMKGSYNLEKQKFASNFFSNICGKMESNTKDATLCIISQIRTKIGTSFGKKSYRAGGKALDFYTHQVAWIREVQKLKKTKKKMKRVYAIQSEVKVERSKVAKPFRDSRFTILFDYGLDDINSMIDFLWGSKTIRFDDMKFKTRERFIKYIEENNLEQTLALETEETWLAVEKRFEDEVAARKTRY